MISIGTIIDNRYKITSFISEGGMSLVYEAKDLENKKTVVIKILREELLKDHLNVVRFNFEADVQSRLDHPNIVRVYAKGTYEDKPYIVSEYIVGHTLNDNLRLYGKYSVKEGTKIMLTLTKAVQYLHEKGIIHRDIKSQNVFYLQRKILKLTDFGIAITKDMVKNISKENAIVGSPHYLAPEVISDGIISELSDIYALGVTYFELLTNQYPFVGEDAIEVALSHVNNEPPLPSSINENIPEEIENIMLKAIAKDPKDRYQSAKELALDLEKALNNEENFVKEKKGLFSRIFGLK